jgi:3-deoxy-D-manno-octulosonic-acid transferase
VVEPAAFGAPVMFGPRWQMSRDAGLLLQAKGAAALSTADELADQLREWMVSPDARRTAGDRARAVVRAGLGAADRTVALVTRLLEDA